MKVYACKKCRTIFTNADKCPKCGSKEFTEKWQGIIYVIDVEKSEVAKIINLNDKGKYAIIIREK